jgi:hypothetical protein
MIVSDPGHIYMLSALDGGSPQTLTFVKREGDKYPGNVGHYPGTTLQEVLRACINRIEYLDSQIKSPANFIAIQALKLAIVCFEDRAADRHGRHRNKPHDSVYGPQCPKCLHVGCKGQCHP